MSDKVRLMTVSQFAAASGLTQEVVRESAERNDFGDLWAVRVGDAIYIESSELTSWRARRLKVSKETVRTSDLLPGNLSIP